MANTSPTSISLQGWDTANVTSFDVINAAIVKQAKSPPTFAFLSGDPLGTPSIAGTWDTWRLVPGGSGQTLQMQCPIRSGTAILATSTATGLTLDKATAGAALTFDIVGLTVTSPASAPAQPQSVLCSVGRSSGKYYFEVTLGASASNAIVGIAPAGPAGQAFATTTAGAYGYRSDGQAMSAGAAVAFPGGSALTWKQGDTVGVAVDIDGGKVWFRGPDGNWQGTAGADPVTGGNPAFSFTPNTMIYAAVSVGAGDAATANFLEMAGRFQPPAGYAPFVATFSTVTLDGGSLDVQIALAQTPLTPSKTALMADPTSTPTSPAVVVMSFVPPKGSTMTQSQIDQLVLTFNDDLNNDIANFKNIFHTFDANSALANGNLAWLNPTDNQYAVGDTTSAATATSAFALLSMTENRDDSLLGAQIDPRILDGLPTGANSVFAISAERFTAKILLDVATTTLVGSTTTDFDFDSTGLVITNNADLQWREIKLADQSTVTPVVPAGGLKVSIVDEHIELEFTGVHFDVPGWLWPGHKIATLQFTQQIFLELATGTNAKGNTIHYLLAKNVDPDSSDPAAIAADLPTITDAAVSVSFDQAAINFQDAMIGVSIVLSVLTIGLVAFSAARWIIRSQQVAQDAASAVASGDGDVALQGIQDPSVVPRAPYASLVDAAPDAVGAGVAAVQAGSGAAAQAGVVAAGGVLFVTKVAIGTTIAAVISGIGTATFWSIYGTSTAKDLSDAVVANLPADFAVESLLTQAFQAYDWTGTANNWTVVDARLAESLLIYGALS